MKVIVNRCFGGASLSPEAVKMAVEAGVGLTSYERKLHSSFELSKPWEDLGDGWACQRGLLGDVMKDGMIYSPHLDSDVSIRTNPVLIQVIETLGEQASGPCSQLEIVEVPDGTQIQIEEYDGQEWVAEKHQTW